MTDQLKLTAALNRSQVAALPQPQLVYLLLELSPGRGLSGQRLPLNFALVLDRSGSMAGEKINTLKAAVNTIIDQLADDDVVAIIPFESRPQVLVPAGKVGDRAGLKRRVATMRASGGTRMGQALQTGLEQARLHAGAGRTSRIVLLTDGEATDALEVSRQAAEQAGELGIPIIGLGFGSDWNEDFLAELVRRSSRSERGAQGYADYIPDAAQVERIFQEVYQSMQVVGRGTTLTVRLAQGLQARRAWQATPLIRDLGDEPFQERAAVLPVGDLEQGGAAYLLEVMLPPRPAGMVRIAQVEAVCQAGQGQAHSRVDVVVHYSTEGAGQVNGRVMGVVDKVQAFKLQTQALQQAEAGDIRLATQKLRAAVTILLDQGETELAGQMQAEAERLERSGVLSSQARKTIQLTSRKTIRLPEQD
jgi:Ca-activated chloride channel family protein